MEFPGKLSSCQLVGMKTGTEDQQEGWVMVFRKCASDVAASEAQSKGKPSHY